MSSKSLRNGLALVLAVAGLAGGVAFASGLVNVRLSPTEGPAGATVAVSATGFRDSDKRTTQTTTYWAEISIGDAKVATNVPVAADLSVNDTVAMKAAPGDQKIVVVLFARDAQGTRTIDSGSSIFRVIDPGPAHPLAVDMGVVVPERAVSGSEIVARITLRSGPGDKTKVGLNAAVFDQANKLKQSLTFPAVPPAQGQVADRVEMMSPARTEQFSSGPFNLPAGTWRIHFILLVNNVAHDLDRTIIVGAAAADPAPNKPPPHLAPGAPSR